MNVKEEINSFLNKINLSWLDIILENWNNVDKIVLPVIFIASKGTRNRGWGGFLKDLAEIDTRFSHEIFLSRLCRYDEWVVGCVSINGRSQNVKLGDEYHEPISLSMSNPLSMGEYENKPWNPVRTRPPFAAAPFLLSPDELHTFSHLTASKADALHMASLRRRRRSRQGQATKTIGKPRGGRKKGYQSLLLKQTVKCIIDGILTFFLFFFNLLSRD